MFPLRISYSSRNTLHSCERDFQLYKLIGPEPKKENKPHFSHGHAFGAGVADYLLHGDKQSALYQTWLAYWPDLEEPSYSAYHSMLLVESAMFHLDKVRREWDVAVFQGKPAIELSARININPEMYEAAHIDVVLVNKKTGKYAVWENKSTGSRLNDISPLYKNSSQTIGYSIILDAIAGKELTEFDTFHFVGQTKNKDILDMEFHVLQYPRTLMDRINWFITLGLDVKHIQEMQSLNYFPMRGQSCLKYNRVCSNFGTCHLRKTDRPREQVEDKTVYQFEFFLDDIVADHIARAKETL